jgi:dynein heavy chain
MGNSRISIQLVDFYLTKSLVETQEVNPWGNLKYLIGDVMYGGCVTCDFDHRVLTTYIGEYMGDFLFDVFQKFHFCEGKISTTRFLRNHHWTVTNRW